MARGPGRGRNADLPVALVAIAVFVVYVWVLTRAATPIVTALSTLSGNNPWAYAALLAVLVGLPGLLFTLPRALARRRVLIVPMVRSRGQLAAQRTSHLRTDVLGIALLLLAQVPLPGFRVIAIVLAVAAPVVAWVAVTRAVLP